MEPETQLEMKDHTVLCECLKDMDQRGLIQLGGALGLDYPNLQRMKYLPEDMVAAWLREEDRVLDTSGKPMWESLIKSLEKIGQHGIAQNIQNLDGPAHTNYVDGKSEKNGRKGRFICPAHKSYLAVILALILVLCILYYFWPTLTYNFKLYHSKSLPYSSENFAGREKEMKEVVKLVDFLNPHHDIRIIDIIGSPGFGKSTLAIHVGHEMVKRNVVVHYVNLADFPDRPSVQQVLAEKVLESSRISAKSADLHRLVRWAHNRYWYNLLILDNCDHIIHNQREDFQSALEEVVKASRNVKVLMTSRREIVIDPFSKSYSITELSTEAACKVLEYGEQYGVELTSDQKLHIAKLVGNIPLALHIFKSLLDRTGSPPPNDLIRELEEEPIETLSPPDFQSHKQVNATLNLSYKYLSQDLQVISRQLTLFPGSFSRDAGVVVLSNGSQANSKHRDIDESLRYLVRSSLLQFDQRKDRFQYHQLIKEYFVCITSPNDTTKLLPAFYIYYATLLTAAYNSSRKFEVSMAMVDSDRHNFHHLLNALKTMQLPYSTSENIFFTIAIAIATSANTDLLKVSFPASDLHAALKNALDQFDYYVINNMSPYYDDPEFFFHYYVLIMHLLSTTEGSINGDTGVSEDNTLSRVHADREIIIEIWERYMSHDDYIGFYKDLKNYYTRLDHKPKIDECKQKIFIRVNIQLHTCARETQCTHAKIGAAYFEKGDYHKAAESFEKALEEETDTMQTARLLVDLTDTYSNLNKHEKMVQTVSRLCTLHGSIIEYYNTTGSELLWHHHTVTRIFKVCGEHGFNKEAGILYENYIEILTKVVEQKDMAEITCCDQVPSIKLVYNVLNEIYGIEYHKAVVKLGSLVIYALNKQEDIIVSSDNILKLKFQFLVGKAKIHGNNYNTSDGLDDIEYVLEAILNLEDKLAGNLEDERKAACWYLIPRVIYIESCYNVKKAVYYATVRLIFTPVLYELYGRLASQVFPPSKFTKQTQIPSLSPSTEMQLATTICPFYMLPLEELWQEYTNFVKPTLSIMMASLKSLHDLGTLLAHLIIIFLKLICIPLDMLLVWIRLMLPYITYLYIRQRHLFKIFIAEVLFWCFIVPMLLFPVYILISLALVITLKPNTLFTFTCGFLRIVRDPRFKYDVISI